MPFDPMPVEKPTVVPHEPDARSLNDFAAWLATFPPALRYSYFVYDRCLLTQWAAYCGYGRTHGTRVDTWVKRHGFLWLRRDKLIIPYNSPMGLVAITLPWTFGDAYRRALAAEKMGR